MAASSTLRRPLPTASVQSESAYEDTMKLDFLPLASTLLIGSAAGLGAFAGRNFLAQGLDYVERDVADKLRALRISTRSLHTLLVAWAATVGGVLVVLGIVLESLIPAAAVCAMLACLPWYIVRRLAERRRRQLDDQLADAMVAFSNGVRAGLSLPQAMEI